MNEVVYAALDLELTGLKPGRDEITEIGIVRCTPERVIERWSSLVRPKKMPPLRVQRLTGITPEMLEDAPAFADIEADVRRLLGGAIQIGHNIEFDQEALATVGIWPAVPSIDTLPLAQILYPSAPSHRLGDLCERLGIDHGDAHRALADAEGARLLYLQLRDIYRALPHGVRSSLAKLAERTQLRDWSTGRTLREIEDHIRRSASRSRFPVSVVSSNVDQLPDDQLPEEPEVSDLPEQALVRLQERMYEEQTRQGPALERREEQIQMAEVVWRTLREGDTSIVEAGTGTGKSLAYLIPSAIYALATGERVVVSTNTINLQHQLFDQDAPLVRRLLGSISADAAEKLFVAVVKGRGNYLCQCALKGALGEVEDFDQAQLLARLVVWESQTSTGDRAEIRLTPTEIEHWEPLCASEQGCTYGPAQCPLLARGGNFVSLMRKRASAAHVVLTNHALLVADAGNRLHLPPSGVGTSSHSALPALHNVLPAARGVIVDEAHTLEDAATNVLTEEMPRSWLIDPLERIFRIRDKPQGLAVRHAERNLKAAERLKQDVPAVVEQLTALYRALAAFASDHTESKSGADHRVRLTRATRMQRDWEELASRWVLIAENLTTISSDLAALESGETPQISGLPPGDLMRTRELLLRRMSPMKAVFGEFDEQVIAWIDSDRRGRRTKVFAAPRSVAEELQQIWDRHAGIVLTGATLAASDRFDFLLRRLGIEEADETKLGSPFDFRRNARLYLPREAVDAPDLDHAEFVARAVQDLAVAAEGRTMVLFTSYASMKRVGRLVEEGLAGNGLRLLQQARDGRPERLTQLLRSDSRTVLLGVASMWTGVDIPGDALSLLLIARLPFGNPRDPVSMARSEEYEDPFNEYLLPPAILQFRQGFGRLLRTETDRGAVVVLDRRIRSRNYGRSFLTSVPPAPVFHLPLDEIAQDLRRFLRNRQALLLPSPRRPQIASS